MTSSSHSRSRPADAVQLLKESSYEVSWAFKKPALVSAGLFYYLFLPTPAIRGAFALRFTAATASIIAVATTGTLFFVAHITFRLKSNATNLARSANSVKLEFYDKL